MYGPNLNIPSPVGTDLDGTEIPMFPADLAGEPLLLAHAGMVRLYSLLYSTFEPNK